MIDAYPCLVKVHLSKFFETLHAISYTIIVTFIQFCSIFKVTGEREIKKMYKQYFLVLNALTELLPCQLNSAVMIT